MDDEQYKEFVEYFTTKSVPHSVVNISNWKQKTQNYLIGEPTIYGNLYYRKLIVENSREMLNEDCLNNIGNLKEGVDYKKKTDAKIKFQIVIKKSISEKLVQDAHLNSCHGGRNSMRYILKDVYLKKKESLINRYRVCADCDSLKAIPEELPFTPIFSHSPGERIQFDFTFFKSSTIFTVIDHFTKYAFGYFVKSRKTSTVIENLQESFKKLQKYGEVPINIIQSDNGAEFCSQKLKDFCLAVKINLIHGRVRHPQSQGCIERFHRSLKKNMKLFIMSGKTVEQSVVLSVKAYNTTFHHTVCFLILLNFYNYL